MTTKCTMNEYECWLQDRCINEVTLNYVPAVIFAESDDEIQMQAAEELRKGLQRLLGYSPALFFIGPDTPYKASDRGGVCILLGTISFLNKEYSLSLPDQKPDGFIIRYTKEKIIIAGQNQAGMLYGAFRFLALLSLNKLYEGFECSEAPSARIRMIDHWDETGGSVGRGYSGRSIFWNRDCLSYDSRRVNDYARLLASIGINRLSLNNVNVNASGMRLYTEEGLAELVNLAAIFRPFGIRLFLTVNFASPIYLGGLDTADPLDPKVQTWWKDRANLIYRYIPDLAGFLVKADSEGEPGPFLYDRNQADGANVLAAALAPHSGEVLWRCFVYNCQQDWRDHTIDRARSAYDYFMPLDGTFADNVILQIKFGPYDFQVREPVSPLFGALKKTRYIMELQITQEYTGQQIDLCYLPIMWEDIMNFDTAHGTASKVKELMSSRMDGIAAVGNIGLDKSWTGHTLAQANFYGFGRIAWDSNISADAIAAEWSTLSFGDQEVANTIKDILIKSYFTYEKYNAPFGICFMVTPHTHYGPSVEGYEFDRWGTYHRADIKAIGIDRTPSGTGYTKQYSSKNAHVFADPALCPENNILFFHRLRYDYIMKNGETLLQNIYNIHFEGYDEVEEMLTIWRGLSDRLPVEVYESTLSRMEKQLFNAREWRDQINTYFWRKTGIADKRGRTIYE